MKKTFFITLILMLLLGCGQENKKKEAADPGEGKTRITVSVLPQQYFVRRIAGDKAIINVMIPPGHSPATYEPTTLQMRDVSDSDIYFRIGHIPFEKVWMGNIKAANPEMKMIDTSRGVRLIRSGSAQEAEDEHEQHASGETAHSHDHRGIDPHIWLSPAAVKVQAKNILTALSRFDPANKAFYENNYRTFAGDIDWLHEELNNLFTDLQSNKIMVFHPAWSYFARDFDLLQVAIEVEGKEPNPADLKRAIDTAKKEGIRVIFVQKQFATHSAQAVANEIDGKVVILDPLAAEWLSNMKKIGETLKEAL